MNFVFRRFSTHYKTIKSNINFSDKMGNAFANGACPNTRILWCDTEGGIRGCPLWDVCFIDEDETSVRAYRFCVPADATKPGRRALAKELPFAVFLDSVKNKRVAKLEYNLNETTWDLQSSATLSSCIGDEISAFLKSKAESCVLTAWNLRGHDRHVLKRNVTAKVYDSLVMWDCLPWFRSNFVLPKNTLASNKPGTPRAVFHVPSYGSAHSALVDASHMREVVLRSTFCLGKSKIQEQLEEFKDMDRCDLFKRVYANIAEICEDSEWEKLKTKAWEKGHVPESVFSDNRLSVSKTPHQKSC